MKILFYLCCLILLMNTGCRENETTSLDTIKYEGELLLKIDPQQAPQEVTVVIAYLTRQGYTTISGYLNLLSDSTAEIALHNIAAGNWHLKVDAADAQGIVRYSGETEVSVQENQTTQVTLVLVPVTSGVGSIYLYVMWGKPPSAWLDYSGNPIMPGAYSKVIYDENKYKMWYTGLFWKIEYAESYDGVNWNINSNNPILVPGVQGSWDDFAVLVPCVLKDDYGYKMYYCGRQSHYQPWHIGLATSPDGIHWTKYPVPVLYAGSGWEYQVCPSEIIKKDGTYYLYYTGNIYTGANPVPSKIALATSTDGIHFVRYSQNPILLPSALWEGEYLLTPSVRMENSQFKMIYVDSYNRAMGEASSNDGKHWIKSLNNPIFKQENTYNHWTSWIGYPGYVKVNQEVRVYYTGEPETHVCKIGFIKVLN